MSQIITFGLVKRSIEYHDGQPCLVLRPKSIHSRRSFAIRLQDAWLFTDKNERLKESWQDLGRQISRHLGIRVSPAQAISLVFEIQDGIEELFAAPPQPREEKVVGEATLKTPDDEFTTEVVDRVPVEGWTQ